MEQRIFFSIFLSKLKMHKKSLRKRNCRQLLLYSQKILTTLNLYMCSFFKTFSHHLNPNKIITMQGKNGHKKYKVLMFEWVRDFRMKEKKSNKLIQQFNSTNVGKNMSLLWSTGLQNVWTLYIEILTWHFSPPQLQSIII